MSDRTLITLNPEAKTRSQKSRSRAELATTACAAMVQADGLPLSALTAVVCAVQGFKEPPKIV